MAEVHCVTEGSDGVWSCARSSTPVARPADLDAGAPSSVLFTGLLVGLPHANTSTNATGAAPAPRCVSPTAHWTLLVCDANLPGARTLYKQDAHPPWLLRCHRDFLRAAGACVRPTHRPHPLLDRLQEITKSNSWGDTDEILTDGLAGWILVPID